MQFFSVAITILATMTAGCRADKLDCGWGTHEEDGSCVPDEESGTGDDMDTADTEAVEYERFNCTDDGTTVNVGTSSEVFWDDCEGRDAFDIKTASCDERLGEAFVSPCDGPIGAVHTVVVSIYPPWGERVAGVTVQLGTDAGHREVELMQDPANSGLYKGEFTTEEPAKTLLLGVEVWALPTEDEWEWEDERETE
jgi:hypothetical protein